MPLAGLATVSLPVVTNQVRPNCALLLSNASTAADIKFALNCGLTFYTAEAFFLGSDPNPTRVAGFNAQTFLAKSRMPVSPSNLPIVQRVKEGMPPPKPEVVVFVGAPASGKSTFYKTYFASTRASHSCYQSV
jgi:bifunctional polynucleotide phosphatase/kinase